jgi:integrase
MILAPQTIAVLKEWKQEYDRWKELNGDRWQNSPYVFVKEDGGAMHPDSVTDWLGRFSKANTLPHIHPHAFRHTAASTMILNGVDMVSAAAELGHASPSTTANIYAHQFAIARAKAASVRAGVFANRK